MSKIQIWKRITTDICFSQTYVELYLICQRYKFESESQPRGDYKPFQIMLYLICQRYKFESESQQKLYFQPRLGAVFNMSKIQIWKRITTCVSRCLSPIPLYLICQRYKFESESQRTLLPRRGRVRCI